MTRAKIQTNSVFLVGSMGAGKTTTGRRLARRLSRAFYDADHVVEERTGVDVPFIFEKEGETGFRQRETAILDELSRLNDIVLATGGGAVLSPENRAMLKERGTVVYLATTVDEQLKRLRKDKKRPLLQTPDRRAVLEKLFAERDPLYREVADIVVSTDRFRGIGLSREISRRIRQLHRAEGAVK